MQTQTYTPEFRAEAVKLVLAQGLSLEEAAQRSSEAPFFDLRVSSFLIPMEWTPHP